MKTRAVESGIQVLLLDIQRVKKSDFEIMSVDCIYLIFTFSDIGNHMSGKSLNKVYWLPICLTKTSLNSHTEKSVKILIGVRLGFRDSV